MRVHILDCVDITVILHVHMRMCDSVFSLCFNLHACVKLSVHECCSYLEVFVRTKLMINNLQRYSWVVPVLGRNTLGEYSGRPVVVFADDNFRTIPIYFNLTSFAALGTDL